MGIAARLSGESGGSGSPQNLAICKPANWWGVKATKGCKSNEAMTSGPPAQAGHEEHA
jgi:hypothetical protein